MERCERCGRSPSADCSHGSQCPYQRLVSSRPAAAFESVSSPFQSKPTAAQSVWKQWDTDDEGDGATAVTTDLLFDTKESSGARAISPAKTAEVNPTEAPTSSLPAVAHSTPGPFTPKPREAITNTSSVSVRDIPRNLPATPTPLPSVDSKKTDRMAAPRLTRDPYVGRSIGHFVLEKKIGQGGFGSVYLARHTLLEQKFAIKILNLNQQTPDIVERFRREARALTLLRHNNVVHIADFGQSEELGFYLAMEFLEGKSLQDAISDQETFSLSRLHNLYLQLCSVMQYAHSKGILHRDLKPSNIYLTRESDGGEKVKLIDFGIASIVEEGNQLTQSGTSLGSPTYMSPEQARGEKLIDGRTDLYALGVILMQLLTGKAPFRGPNFAAILTKKLFEKTPSLSVERPDLQWSPQLENFVLKAMADEPLQRPMNAIEFWRQCELALQAQAESHPDGSSWTTGHLTVDSGSFPTMPGLETPQPSLWGSDSSTANKYEELVSAVEDSMELTGQQGLLPRNASTLTDEPMDYREELMTTPIPAFKKPPLPTETKVPAAEESSKTTTPSKGMSRRWVVLVLLLVGGTLGISWWASQSFHNNPSTPVVVPKRKVAQPVLAVRPTPPPRRVRRPAPLPVRPLPVLLEWRVNSVPEKVEVWSLGKKAGLTPFLKKGRTGDRFVLTLKKKGYKDKTVEVKFQLSSGSQTITLEKLVPIAKKAVPRPVVRKRPKPRVRKPRPRVRKRFIRRRKAPPKKRNLYGIDDPI